MKGTAAPPHAPAPSSHPARAGASRRPRRGREPESGRPGPVPGRNPRARRERREGPAGQAGGPPVRHPARLLAECGLADGVTPHTLRHSFATAQMEAGTSLPVLQAQLGHRDISSTQVYLYVATHLLMERPSPLDPGPLRWAGPPSPKNRSKLGAMVSDSES